MDPLCLGYIYDRLTPVTFVRILSFLIGHISRDQYMAVDGRIREEIEIRSRTSKTSEDDATTQTVSHNLAIVPLCASFIPVTSTSVTNTRKNGAVIMTAALHTFGHEEWLTCRSMGAFVEYTYNQETAPKRFRDQFGLEALACGQRSCNPAAWRLLASGRGKVTIEVFREHHGRVRFTLVTKTIRGHRRSDVCGHRVGTQQHILAILLREAFNGNTF